MRTLMHAARNKTHLTASVPYTLRLRRRRVCRDANLKRGSRIYVRLADRARTMGRKPLVNALAVEAMHTWKGLHKVAILVVEQTHTT